MDLNVFLPKVVIEFEKWYSNDEHSKHINIYDNIITEENIKSLSDNDFINLFYNFVAEGGKIQSGGDRTKNLFKDFIENNLFLSHSIITLILINGSPT